MNAIEMLKEDHQIVDNLFKQVESTPPSEHKALFKRIKGELETHAHLEEVIFYPALKKRGDKDAKDIVLEGIEEHHHMHISLGEIGGMTPRNETFDPKLKVMIEMVRHHVKEEEGVGGMFSQAEDQLGTEALEKLGEQMLAEKQKFVKANRIKPEPRPEPSALGAMMERAKDLVTSAFGGDGGSDNKKVSGKKAPAAAPAARAKAASASAGSSKASEPKASARGAGGAGSKTNAGSGSKSGGKK